MPGRFSSLKWANTLQHLIFLSIYFSLHVLATRISLLFFFMVFNSFLLIQVRHKILLLSLVCCCGFALKGILNFLRTSHKKYFYFRLMFALFCLFLCSFVFLCSFRVKLVSMSLYLLFVIILRTLSA